MSDHELRADSLEAGHRRADKKPRLPKGARPARARGEKKAKSGPSVARRLGGLGGALAAPLGVAKRAGRTVWGVWDRAYDGAMARPVRAVKIYGIVTAALVVLAGLCWLGGRHYDSLNEDRFEVASQGEGAVGALMSYSFRTIDRQVEKTQKLVTGSFKDDYAKYINTSIAPAAKDKQAEVQTAVDRSAIVSINSSEAVMLMFLDQDSTSLDDPDGNTTTSALRVKLEKEDGKWKVSELTPV